MYYQCNLFAMLNQMAGCVSSVKKCVMQSPGGQLYMYVDVTVRCSLLRQINVMPAGKMDLVNCLFHLRSFRQVRWNAGAF